jgi:hypothetical protein
MWKKIAFLLAISTAVQSNDLDNLINSSSAIVDQIDTGIKLTGAAMDYAHTGGGLSDGTLSSTAHISAEQVEAYNSALSNMATYQPYGNVRDVLNDMAIDSLDEMETAITTFSEVVVEMIAVQQVAEKAETATTPSEKEEVQTFIVDNQDMLTIDQEDVDTYNTSVDQIETSANEASAYLAVANNDEAADFLQQSIQDKNTTADDVNIFYDAGEQWVAMGYNTTRNLTAVYLNGSDAFGLDLYYSEADILALGTESEFYKTSPVGMGYDCFFEMECE